MAPPAVKRSKRSRSEGPTVRTRKEEVMFREELKKEEAQEASKERGAPHGSYHWSYQMFWMDGIYLVARLCDLAVWCFEVIWWSLGHFELVDTHMQPDARDPRIQGSFDLRKTPK